MGLVVLISEAELRELWQNGRVDLPVFPLGTRFTPAAQDFLKDNHLTVRFSESAAGIPLPVRVTEHDRMGERRGTAREIYTEADLTDLYQQGIREIEVGEKVYLTDLAKEKAFKLGMRIVREPGAGPTASMQASHNNYRYVTAAPGNTGKEAMTGKTIYTEADIDRMYQEGSRSIEVGEGVILTGLAVDKAALLGMKLVQRDAAAVPAVEEQPLFAVIKQKVMARMQGGVDEKTVDAVIRRVLENIH